MPKPDERLARFRAHRDERRRELAGERHPA